MCMVNAHKAVRFDGTAVSYLQFHNLFPYFPLKKRLAEDFLTIFR
jgi:hypothetical protein